MLLLFIYICFSYVYWTVLFVTFQTRFFYGNSIIHNTFPIVYTAEYMCNQKILYNALDAKTSRLSRNVRTMVRSCFNTFRQSLAFFGPHFSSKGPWRYVCKVRWNHSSFRLVQIPTSSPDSFHVDCFGHQELSATSLWCGRPGSIVGFSIRYILVTATYGWI